MGGFTLAGKKYVFTSSETSVCMCYGLYGFIDEPDEEVLFENNTLDIAKIEDKISDELKKYLHKLLKSHPSTITNYTISERSIFIVPSYWNPNKKLYI